MICISIADVPMAECVAGLPAGCMAEIRFDRLKYDEGALKTLIKKNIPVIATYRAAGSSDAQRLDILKKAVALGASWLDIELEADIAYKQELIGYARFHQCRVIISYHHFQGTPSSEILQQIKEQCYADGADLAKIACLVQFPQDNAKILSLYAEVPPGKQLLAIGMGAMGKITRLAAPWLGAPFTFAALSADNLTAPGQMTAAAMQSVFDQINQSGES
jgi:3-dehydroquinate dehydratase-1